MFNIRKLQLLVFAFLVGCMRTQECTPPPQAIQDIVAEKFYTDARNSIPNPDIVAQNELSLMRLDAALKHIIADSDAYVAKGDEGRGQCAATWLSAWAGQSALTGHMSSMQAEYERKWRTAGLALTYLKIAPIVSAEQRTVIDAWFNHLAKMIEITEAQENNGTEQHYWVGLVATSVGFATHNASQIAYGHRAFDDGLKAIDAENALPYELQRGQRALHYHHYSLFPMIMMAEVAAHSGENWYNDGQGAIHRLVRFTTEMTHNPEILSQDTGFKQEEVQSSEVGWQIFYTRRFPKYSDGLDNASFFYSPWLGGDIANLARAWINKSS